jgi:hypothetical protein
MVGSSWVAAQLAASQEGLSSMELVSSFNSSAVSFFLCLISLPIPFVPICHQLSPVSCLSSCLLCFVISFLASYVKVASPRPGGNFSAIRVMQWRIKSRRVHSHHSGTAVCVWAYEMCRAQCGERFTLFPSGLWHRETWQSTSRRNIFLNSQRYTSSESYPHEKDKWALPRKVKRGKFRYLVPM